MEPQSKPSPSLVLFARGVIARLSIWSILTQAIAENWGGPHGLQKRTWLASIIVDAFEEHPADQHRAVAAAADQGNTRGGFKSLETTVPKQP